MGTSAIPTGSTASSPERTTHSDVAVQAVAKALKMQKDTSASLIRLVEQANPSGDKGQHVNYFA